MPSAEIELATPLLAEVVEWVQSGSILAGPQDDVDAYTFSDGSIPLQVVDISEWHVDVDIDNEDSRYVDLIDLTREVEGAFRLIHQFGPEDFGDFTYQKYEAVQKSVVENDVVEAFARSVHESSDKKNATWEEDLEHMHSTVLSHFNGILRSRAVSLSKRHAPMEALFHAYQQGLLPFGWDWESIVCINPNCL